MGGDLEILRRCDALICMENWQRSAGACDEVAIIVGGGDRVERA